MLSLPSTDGRFSTAVQLDSRVVISKLPSRKVREAERGKSGFVYKWTNQKNGRWYIGSHIGDPNDPKDQYVASGRNVINAMRKYGLDNFRREILFVGLDC